MKKFLKLTALIFCLSLFGSTAAYAAENSDFIRVGLEYKYKSVSSVPVNNTGITAGFDLNGDRIAAANLISLNGFTVNADYSYYVQTNDNYSDYQSAYQGAQNYRLSGYSAAPVLLGYNNFGIYIGGYQSAEEAMSLLNNGLGSSIAAPNIYMTNIKDGSETVLVSNCEGSYLSVWDITGDVLNLGERSYRGSVEFVRTAGSGMTAVNVLGVDEYLYSVVPSEMPSAWNIEALKAQTVAARSYTYTRTAMHVHADNSYDLCDGIHCQVYNGFHNETESSLTAVNETKGLAAYYQDEIINATFFSSSGGYTENSEDIWTNELGYLRAVSDLYESEYKEWTRTFTMDEITAILTAKNIAIGSAQSVTISTGANGRVAQLTINGSAGSHTVTKDEVRTFFSSSAGGSLESRNFVISYSIPSDEYNPEAPVIDDIDYSYNSQTLGVGMNYITDQGLVTVHSGNTVVTTPEVQPETEQTNDYNTGNPIVINNTPAPNSYQTYTSSGNSVTFTGKGWGHGVGLSQYGAKGMAEAGFTFDQILKHYYTGIIIK